MRIRVPGARRRVRDVLDAGADPPQHRPSDQLPRPERAGVGAGQQQRPPALGLLFEDSVPLIGDEASAEPRWKSAQTLARYVNDWVRLEFRLYQAQVYAIHWDFRIQYGDPIIERI